MKELKTIKEMVLFATNIEATVAANNLQCPLEH
jgi:hypothetical protein